MLAFTMLVEKRERLCLLKVLVGEGGRLHQSSEGTPPLRLAVPHHL